MTKRSKKKKSDQVAKLAEILKSTGYAVEHFELSDGSCRGLVVKHNPKDDEALHFNFDENGLYSIQLWKEIKQVVDEKRIW
jgi:hypothetical protein